MEQAPSSRPRAQHERFQALPLHSKTERHPAQLAQPYESMSLNHLFCYSATLLLCYSATLFCHAWASSEPTAFPFLLHEYTCPVAMPAAPAPLLTMGLDMEALPLLMDLAATARRSKRRRDSISGSSTKSFGSMLFSGVRLRRRAKHVAVIPVPSHCCNTPSHHPANHVLLEPRCHRLILETRDPSTSFR